MRSQCNGQHMGAQIIVGIAVIAIGFLFLFDNLGWLDIDIGMQFWPLLLILAGVLKISQSRSQSHSRRGSIVGGVMLLVGVVLLLQSVGLLYFGWNVLAPLIMIGAGLALVFRPAGRQARHDKMGELPVADGEESTIALTSILGAYKRRMSTQSFAGGEITVIMAGCDLDLRQASMGSVAVLNVFALMGGINLRVPLDWTIEMDGLPLVGGFQDFTVHPQDSGKRLVVRGTVIMGGLDVRN